ncbi:lactosylceramide 1,3-N-acetyl-beta-D-glucosaminyltransferase A-like isoform X2 [Dreissena polymorpha]|nr:lactosylceramide 1,3-N-acetyl-beta-D-glucosaminyltransferase A-like isoform X2 [Dreissena polymorpha]
MKQQRVNLERTTVLDIPHVLRTLLKISLRFLKAITAPALVTVLVFLVFGLNYTFHLQTRNVQWKGLEIQRMFKILDEIKKSPTVATTKIGPPTTTTLSPEFLAISPDIELDKLINRSSGEKYPIFNGNYVFENPILCLEVKNLSVLIIVHTAPDHFEMRLAIRRTWANDTYYRQYGVSRVLFLLGRVEDATLQEKIEAEFKDYRDMLQGDFRDAYRNLTHKGVMGYRWITERCRNAKFILKTDDDIVVNMFQLFNHVLPNFHNKTKQIFCNHIYANTMPIIREKTSKWYVNEHHFRGKTVFPEYCSGFIVLFTNDVIPAIYSAATMTPFFWVDDVYLYGLAPSHVPGIKYSDMKDTDHMLDWQKALSCYRNVTENLGKKCEYLVTGSRTLQVSEETWIEMRKQFDHVLGTNSTSTTATPSKHA